MNQHLEHRVAGHYGKPGLLQAILSGLEKPGIDSTAPTIDDLSPVDEFHTGGRTATLETLKLAPVTSDMHVLDAGSGIGGTARYFATKCGCRVTGIDLTPEYVEVANALTERTGLSHLCDFHAGSVVDMPFSQNCFDAAMTFHVAMNVEDRIGFYSEVARVLKPGSRFCMFDVMQGPNPFSDFPVPWSSNTANSFLMTPDETIEQLSIAGFSVIEQASLRNLALASFRKANQPTAGPNDPPPLGLHLLIGSDAKEKLTNYMSGIQEERLDPVIIVAKCNMDGDQLT